MELKRKRARSSTACFFFTSLHQIPIRIMINHELHLLHEFALFWTLDVPAQVNGAALSDRIRICRDSASSCLVMSESLDKIRLAVAQTVDKVAKLSADPSGKSQSQSDRMGKKLLVSSSERVEQTGRRAADEAISCAMKASDVVKGMSALLLEMRDRLKRANRPQDPDREDRSSAEENATDAEQSKEACRKNKDEGASKNNKDQESSASGNKTAKEKKLEATTNRLRERHLVLRNKNLSFLSQINDEARDWQSTLYGLAGGRMEVAEKEDLVAQLIEIFDVALWDLAHERGEITQARLEKHFLFLLHLDSRLAVPTDVRSKIFLMAAYADQSMVVDSLDLLRRKVMQVLATKRTSGGKAHVKEWLGTVWQRILGNLKRFLTCAGFGGGGGRGESTGGGGSWHQEAHPHAAPSAENIYL